MKLCLLLAQVFLTLCLCSRFNAERDWGYIYGTITPDKWSKEKLGFCDGWQQSPIDIQTSSAVYFPFLKPPMFEVYTSLSADVEIINDGHKVSAKFPNKAIRIEMDNLTDLCVYHVHWHWGSKDSQGSEHTVDGIASPIEAHVVTYDCKKFKLLEDAVTKPGGLAVFGFFYEITEDKSKENPVLKSVTDVLKKAAMKQAASYTKAKKDTIPMFDMKQLLPSNLYDFYRYMGSLTTPDCTENVLWTVFQKKAYITKEQLNLFRSLKYPNSDKPLVDNYRPVQLLNPARSRMAYRVVLSSFSSSERISAGNIYMVCLMLIVLNIKSLY